MKEGGGRPIDPLGGVGATIEADEIDVGGKAATGPMVRSRPGNPVMSLVERGGRVRSIRVQP
jgi:hypothetical protein